MSAANTDKFIKGAKNWVGAIGAGGVSDAVVTTVPLVSSTNLPTDTAVEITIDRVDANGTETPSKMEVVRGVVSSTNIIDCIRGVEGTAQAHSAGAIVEVMLTASQWNSMIDAMIEGHSQDGSHDFSGFDAKTALVDADSLILNDSEDAGVMKKTVWSNIKSVLKTYFDTLYLTASSVISQRINPRTTTEASSATPTINTDNTDIHTITALALAITSFTTNLSGTPVNGQKLIIRIKDDGEARAITWGASFASRGATLPTTTVLGKYLYVGLIYNSTASVWDCVAVSQEI